MTARLLERLLVLLVPALGVQADPGARAACAELAARPGAPALVEVRCLVDAGRRAEALLAIERVLAIDPANGEARMLERGILASLEERAAGGRPQARSEPRAWIAGLLGYDTNLAAGTDAAQVSLPLFRNTVIDVEEKLGDLRRRASPVAGVGAGFDAARALDAASTLRVTGLAALRYHSRAAGYLPHDYRLAAEVDRRFEALRPSIGVEATERWVGQYSIVRRGAIGARIAIDAGAGLEATPFAGAARIRLPILDDLPLRARSHGIEVLHRASALRVAYAEGRERSSDPRRELDRDSRGWRAAWSAPAGEAWLLHLSLEWTRARYVEYSQLFLGHRVDRFRELQVALERRVAPGWFVMPQLVHQRNRSNVPLTAFSRTQLLVELRREY